MSAELFVDGAEQQPPHRHGKLRRDSLEQPPLAVLAPRADLPLDAVHEELKRLGHQDDVGDAVRAKRLEDHRRLTADGVDHRGAAAQRHQQTARLLQHVAERHQGQQPVRRPDRHRPDGAQDVGEYVALGEHHALGVAGRAGGEHHLRQVVGGDFGTAGAGVSGLDERLQVVEQGHGHGAVQGAVRRLARQEGQLGRRVLDDALHEVGRRPDVQGHCDHARAHAAEEGGDPFRAVYRPDDGPVALFQPSLRQEGGHTA